MTYLGRDIVFLFGELQQLFLQRYGCVVSTEHLGRESRHEAVEILVEGGRVEAVEEVVASLKHEIFVNILSSSLLKLFQHCTG